MAGNKRTKRIIELFEHVKVAELEAVGQLLRLIYGQKLPESAPFHLIFQYLRLADCYRAANCTTKLLGHLAATPQT